MCTSLAIVFLAFVAACSSTRAHTSSSPEATPPSRVATPERDEDGDLVFGAQDRCPDAREDHDDFEDEDGCPDDDNDRDRIPDPRDRCVNEPEIYNGTEDEDGCPDQGVAFLVTHPAMGRPSLHHDGRQLFDDDANRAFYDETASWLHGDPGVELIVLAGHVGARQMAHPLARSRELASTARQNLVAQGIAPGRIIAIGFGDLCPLDFRSGPIAIARNNRVVIMVVRVRGESTQVVLACRRGRHLLPPELREPSR